MNRPLLFFFLLVWPSLLQGQSTSSWGQGQLSQVPAQLLQGAQEVNRLVQQIPGGWQTINAARAMAGVQPGPAQNAGRAAAAASLASQLVQQGHQQGKNKAATENHQAIHDQQRTEDETNASSYPGCQGAQCPTAQGLPANARFRLYASEIATTDAMLREMGTELDSADGAFFEGQWLTCREDRWDGSKRYCTNPRGGGDTAQRQAGIRLQTQIHNGQCHFVKRVNHRKKFGFVTRRTGFTNCYCCFSSLMVRVLNEQGRHQLGWTGRPDWEAFRGRRQVIGREPRWRWAGSGSRYCDDNCRPSSGQISNTPPRSGCGRCWRDFTAPVYGYVGGWGACRGFTQSLLENFDYDAFNLQEFTTTVQPTTHRLPADSSGIADGTIAQPAPTAGP